jgi:CDP-glucose 4,6-dehydratase
MSEAFQGTYRGRGVLVTGHTGFKGSWLSLWLRHLGAQVFGVSLDPPTDPNHFAICRIASAVDDQRADVRDFGAFAAILSRCRPEIVFHLAAQPLVRRAFIDPRETFEVNVMGTVNVLEAARRCPSVRAVVVATSDKCYRNVGWDWGYRETDPLGGHEPYAGSKACAELVAEVYRQQRFQRYAEPPSAVGVASARAGNVIGGGDWGADRLIPDVVRAIGQGCNLTLRNPDATRPWQHVLDCLAGYLQLAARLYADPEQFQGAWNFGPSDDASMPVATLVHNVLEQWPGHRMRIEIAPDPPGKEASMLRVDSSKAIRHLGWRPCWPIATALAATIVWYRQYAGGREDMREVSLSQICDYMAAAGATRAAWAAT